MFDAKEIKIKNSANFRDNQIYSTSDPDGQNQEVLFLGGKRLTFYSHPTLIYVMSYGRFPARNGLKLKKSDHFQWENDVEQPFARDFHNLFLMV